MPALHCRGQECVGKRHYGERALNVMNDARGFVPEHIATHFHAESQ